MKHVRGCAFALSSVSGTFIPATVAFLVGCSGADAPTIGTGAPNTSGGTGTTGGTSDGGANTTGGQDPVAACVATCESTYPRGTQLGRAIDACWSRNCSGVCIGIGAGQVEPPTSGSCNYPVSTPQVSCSQCTVKSCCSAWDACFGDPDCSALNRCSIACYR